MASTQPSTSNDSAEESTSMMEENNNSEEESKTENNNLGEEPETPSTTTTITITTENSNESPEEQGDQDDLTAKPSYSRPAPAETIYEMDCKDTRYRIFGWICCKCKTGPWDLDGQDPIEFCPKCALHQYCFRCNIVLLGYSPPCGEATCETCQGKIV